MGSLSGGPSARSSPDSSVFPRDSSSSSMVTWRLRGESLECRPAGQGIGGGGRCACMCAWSRDKAENGHEDLKGLQRCLSQHSLQDPSSPPPHPRPWVGSRPGADPGGSRAILFPCLNFSCLLCGREAIPASNFNTSLPGSHSFPHNSTYDLRAHPHGIQPNAKTFSVEL